ncbi:hypothetical protein L1987_57116 [Smallanthus sonchifolius]|uniref:Uncharacterized protein n=1 Tax=Smallanthus sonchifolius TaxID=185202 RepID=A0ACB9DBP7_9ASTR|nr:hypothetical protein L1987_57116 [Smallanthus sonchifolius]
MDFYSPSSLVYRPGAESDWEEDSRAPMYRSPTPPAARPMFDVRADWIRNPYQTPHLHNQLPPPLRDPYLMPDLYHPNPWDGAGVMHDLQGQRMDSLANQLGYQKELISILEKEILEHRTQTAKAEARSATRVTIAILERIEKVVYKLELPPSLGNVHPTFHVSNLKKCLADENLHIPLDDVRIDETMHFVERPVEIMGREIKQLKRSRIPIVKVRWESKRGPEFTWEREDQMKLKYPHLFADTAASTS